MLSTYRVEVSRTQMYRAKKKAGEQIKGNHGKTYNKLRQYAEMVRVANPRFVAKLEVERINLLGAFGMQNEFSLLGMLFLGIIFPDMTF